MSPNPDSKVTSTQPRPRLADELEKAEYEPLLPVEKRLIGFSLGIGILLLGILVWTSRTVFEAPQIPTTPAGSSSK